MSRLLQRQALKIRALADHPADRLDLLPIGMGEDADLHTVLPQRQVTHHVEAEQVASHLATHELLVRLEVTAALDLEEVVDRHPALPLLLDLRAEPRHLLLHDLVDRRRVEEDLVLPRLAGEQDIERDGVHHALGPQGVHLEQAVINLALLDREAADPRHHQVLRDLARHQDPRAQRLLPYRVWVRKLDPLVRSLHRPAPARVAGSAQTLRVGPGGCWQPRGSGLRLGPRRTGDAAWQDRQRRQDQGQTTASPHAYLTRMSRQKRVARQTGQS